MLGLYIHIPFCHHICTYCDFIKEVAKPLKKEAYINALMKELDYYASYFHNVETVYIGGGTPSALPPKLLNKLLQNINKHLNSEKLVEFTIECNPNDVDIEMAQILRKHGVNRVSLGVQTFNEKQRLFLNRKHSNQDVFKALRILRDMGIHNISIDMIFGLVNQSLDDLNSDLIQLMECSVKHVSYYSLILEERTRLYHLVQQQKVKWIDEDLEGLMYEHIIDFLKNQGYAHYEISNFAKDGKFSYHNLNYWKLGEYIGVGCGSHGLLANQRMANIGSVRDYIQHFNQHHRPKLEIYPFEGVKDALLMGLRMIEGVNVNHLNKRFNVDVFEKYPALTLWIEKGVLEYHFPYLRFSSKGLLIGNAVFEDIL